MGETKSERVVIAMEGSTAWCSVASLGQSRRAHALYPRQTNPGHPSRTKGARLAVFTSSTDGPEVASSAAFLRALRGVTIVQQHPNGEARRRGGVIVKKGAISSSPLAPCQDRPSNVIEIRHPRHLGARSAMLCRREPETDFSTRQTSCTCSHLPDSREEGGTRWEKWGSVCEGRRQRKNRTGRYARPFECVVCRRRAAAFSITKSR